MACIFAICALHSSRILQKVSTKSAAHDVVELLKQELVTIKFVDLFLALPDGTLSIEAYIEHFSVFALLRCVQ